MTPPTLSTLAALALAATALTAPLLPAPALANAAAPRIAATPTGINTHSAAPDTTLWQVSDSTHDDMHMGPVTLGPLELSGGFSRATLPNAPVGGGFLTITNTGDQDDRLVRAESAVAGRTEVHEMAMENDVMRMRELTDGLPIPAGETVVLKPGGYHVMFLDLQQPLVEGETVTLTLTFETAGTVEVPLMIGAPNARAAQAQGHDHGHDDSHDHGSH